MIQPSLGARGVGEFIRELCPFTPKRSFACFVVLTNAIISQVPGGMSKKLNAIPGTCRMMHVSTLPLAQTIYTMYSWCFNTSLSGLLWQKPPQYLKDLLFQLSLLNYVRSHWSFVPHLHKPPRKLNPFLNTQVKLQQDRPATTTYF